MLIKVESTYGNLVVYDVPADTPSSATLARLRGRCVATRSRAGAWEILPSFEAHLDALPLIEDEP
jgi:hypothetical protein